MKLEASEGRAADEPANGDLRALASARAQWFDIGNNSGARAKSSGRNNGVRQCASNGTTPNRASSPYDLIPFATAKSEIRNPDGSVVFSLEGVEVPAAWSQVAADVLAQKYFRKAGIPARVKRVEEESVPSFLWRSVPDETALSSLPKEERVGSESSAKQVFDRLAGAWAYWGWKAGYFDGEEDARAYYDEMRLMLARQMAAPNSPQWFNTGLHWAYGVDGPSQGHYYVDFETG